ncbi:MAG: hypothetical protein WBF54_15355 [Terriglobales bacterium]
MCEQGKISYPTRNAAHVAAKKSGARGIFVYKHEDHYHFTRTVPKTIKHSTPPHSEGPKPYIESAAKLRRKLAEAGRQIIAADKWLAKLEKKKAEEELRAAHRQLQAEYEHELELQAVSEMIARLVRV